MSITDATRQRSIDLAGEIKRAREVVAECQHTVADKEHALGLAQADYAAAESRLCDLIAERDVLAAKAQAEVLAAGETPVAVQDVFTLPGDVFNVPVNGSAKVADSELPQF